MSEHGNVPYFDKLLRSSKANKKQVAVYLDDATVERLDMVAKLFSSLSDSKSFSRNSLIEMAAEKFLETFQKLFL